MTTISVDFSINSTAICIEKETGIEWFSFVSNLNFDRKAYSIHKEINELSNVHVIGYDRNKPKDLDYTSEQNWKIRNADYLADLIFENIVHHVNEVPKVSFEGYSFGSKGNSFIDLITYNTFFKSKIVSELTYDIEVYSPKAVKKYFNGNGNASKGMMVDTLGNLDIDDPLVSYIKNMIGGSDYNPDKVPKPIDDLTDAYAILQYSKRVVS